MSEFCAQGFPVCGSLQCQNFLLSGTFYVVRKQKIEIQKRKKKFSSFQRKKLLLKKES